MSEQPFKQLSWRNRFTKHLIQPLDGVDCFQPFVNLNPENNIFVLNLSEATFLKLFSAVMTGAEISYPDESLQLQAEFLKGIHCPPTLVPEECVNLPTYANNISYSPMNPYIEPDAIPDGYLTQPFLVNGENGNDIPGFEHFDVIVPSGAMTFDINWFEDINESLPSLQIMVQGEGHVNLRFLTIPQGGLVVVTLDNPPNLIDIIAGIVSGAENIVDLNQDLISLPPETAKEIIFPVPVEGAGIHTIYAVFLPILDDSLIPIRFGGGFRGLELCGFLPEGDMGIQNLRFLDCNLEQQNSDGSWSIVDGWEDWLSCVPSGGGGGGVAGLIFKNYTSNPPAPSFSSASTTFVNVTGFSRSHTFTKPYVQIFFQNIGMTGTGGNAMEARIKLNGNVGLDATIARITGNETREMDVSDRWEEIAAGTYNITLEMRVTGGTAGFIQQQSAFSIVVIEYDNPETSFVTAVRISGRELQYQVNGAWVTASDSLATILNGIEAVANNAAAAAAAAQSTANNAQTVASGAVTVNNAQNTRLTNLEGDVSDLQLSVAQHNLDIISLDNRMDVQENLMAQVAFGGVWAWNHDMTVGASGYSAIALTGTYVAGVGWQSVDQSLLIENVDLANQNQITHVELTLQYLLDPALSFVASFKVNGGSFASMEPSVAHIAKGWYRMPNVVNGSTLIEINANADFVLVNVRYLGRGSQVPFD